MPQACCSAEASVETTLRLPCSSAKQLLLFCLGQSKVISPLKTPLITTLWGLQAPQPNPAQTDCLAVKLLLPGLNRVLGIGTSVSIQGPVASPQTTTISPRLSCQLSQQLPCLVRRTTAALGLQPHCLPASASWIAQWSLLRQYEQQC